MQKKSLDYFFSFSHDLNFRREISALQVILSCIYPRMLKFPPLFSPQICSFHLCLVHRYVVSTSVQSTDMYFPTLFSPQICSFHLCLAHRYVVSTSVWSTDMQFPPLFSPQICSFHLCLVHIYVVSTSVWSTDIQFPSPIQICSFIRVWETDVSDRKIFEAKMLGRRVGFFIKTALLAVLKKWSKVNRIKNK